MTFAVVSMMSIGWLVMPFAVWACYAASKRYPGWRNVISGILLGAGAVILFIAFTHLDYVPCPNRPILVVMGEDRFVHRECGGLDPMPWFRVGAATVMSGVLVYGLAQYWSRRRAIL